MKKILSLFMSAVMLVSVLSICNFNAYANDVMTLDQAAVYIKEELKKRSPSIDVRVAWNEDDYYGDSLLVMAVADVPFEKAQTRIYDNALYYCYEYDFSYKTQRENSDETRYSPRNTVDGSVCHITYTINYGREDEIQAEIDKFAKEVDINNLSYFEKIKAIYDYLIPNKYDDTFSKYDVSNALVDKTSVCQGYTSAFYRLCKEFGVECECISGEAINNDPYNGGHAWNIVKLGDFYYNVDVTWDSCIIDQKYPEYTYFLKTDETFSKKHVKNEEYASEPFTSLHPMATKDFNCNDFGMKHTYYNVLEYYDDISCAICGAKIKNDDITNDLPLTNITKTKGLKKSAQISWKKSKDVNGYQIQLATDKKFKKNKKIVLVQGNKKTKKTVKKLKPSKKYYVRIRTYKILNNKKIYSKWSKSKTFKTK